MPNTAKRSGNPAKKAAASKRAAATPDDQEPKKYGQSVWGQAASGALHEELTVPSGETCLCRRPGVEGLMAAGVLHNIDSLTGLVSSEHINRVEGKEELNVDSLMKDQETLSALFDTVDRVVAYVVVEPKVERALNDPTNRKPGVIYTDMIDLDDKMFIFNYAVGGTRDLERFRQESQASVGGLGTQQALPATTE